MASKTGSSEAQDRKARGAFFTPPALCNYVVDWAIRESSDLVMEPSCGEAAFLSAAVHRLKLLSSHPLLDRPVVHGYELDGPSANTARTIMENSGATAKIVVGDFFQEEPRPVYDAVIGNPPYVRYQDFAGESRSRSRAAALRAGVPLSQLASSWASFTIHASLFLKKGGRLGLVLPAELLAVNYAAPVRRYLLDVFQDVRLVLFSERVFPGVQEEVVLLLADGYREGPTSHFHVYQTTNERDLAKLISTSWAPEDPGEKWTASLLDPEAAELHNLISELPLFGQLQDWGETTLGAVTGNNKYFCLSDTDARRWGLNGDELVRISPPGSSHLRGVMFSELAWNELRDKDQPVWLFRPGVDVSVAAQSYIRQGEELGVDLAYKCRVRKPWWRVPLNNAPELFLTYMNADIPRLCLNRAKVHNLNSVHGFYLGHSIKRSLSELLPVAMLNSATLLSGEVQGRSYGGGMLKLEPREADRLLMPTTDLLAVAESDLRSIEPVVSQNLRGRRIDEAIRIVDNVLLIKHAELSQTQVSVLGNAHRQLRTRRDARSGR